ncbi:MAG TPA: GNAT family N-acetyltransferase [Methanoregula sp.]|nr:GNAT family N-acetyltransferase [Methanoregula sp.]
MKKPPTPDQSQNTGKHQQGDIIVRKVRECDRDGIIAIFNYYAATSYAAYPEMPVNDRFFEFLREGTLAFYVLEHSQQVIGFGLIKPVLPFPPFMRTGMLTYFLMPEFTGHGLGNLLIDRLTSDALKMGMTSLVATMASKNIPSIHFHVRNGFTEVGRLQNAGLKFDELFDVVWMQKML